jgi:NAD-dependent protein deacetylases, SIR2 family
MNFTQKVRELREARANNKLVAFVGAGVSANSGIPTWSDLIKIFADKISYNKCTVCKERTSDCPDNNCRLKSHLCQEEYLKIPQYFYDIDSSNGHIEYENIIRNTLACDKPSNDLNDIILRMRPHHIITTNYDKLLEKSKEPNRQLYCVISKDEELLTLNKTQYIIKMHGDIDCIGEIVLKESDYIEYEQNHILIQTYIKSLLIDHTFIFIGYSLNDYNLKLILGWINYLAKEHNIERPNNYIIQSSSSVTQYEEKYFSASNVSIINVNEVPNEILEKHKQIKLPEYGQKIYALLDFIIDEDNDYLIMPLVDVLHDKYQIFDYYERVSFEDLCNVHSFGHVDLKGNTLCFYEEDKYKKFKLALTVESDKAKFVTNILLRSGIASFQYQEDCFDLENNKTVNEELFKLYLDNKYMSLLIQLNNEKNLYTRAYYYYVCIPECGNCWDELQKIEAEISTETNVIRFVFFKYNLLLFKKLAHHDTSIDIKELHKILDVLPQKIKDASLFFDKLQGDMSANLSIMDDLLNKHEQIYKTKIMSMFYGSNLGHLLDLQALAYDYYFYFKHNFLFFDYFKNPKTYLKPYLKSILCTYYPSIDVQDDFEFDTFKENYKLNDYDIDMFSKYTDPEEFLSWIDQYKVKNILLEDNINIKEKFINFCNSMLLSKNRYIFTQLYSFSILISLCEFNEEEISLIINSISEVLLVNESVINHFNLKSMLGAINILIKVNKICGTYEKLIDALTQEKIVEQIIDNDHHEYKRIINILSLYKTDNIVEKVDGIIEKCSNDRKKCHMIYIFRKYLAKENIESLQKYLLEHLNIIWSNEILILVAEKYIPFTQEILQTYITRIESEINRRQKDPNTRSYPDQLQEAINDCIHLYVLGFPLKIELLNKYIDYSDYLMFLIYPDNFDYSKVDTSNYMWCNFFRNEKLATILKKYKNEILTTELEQQYNNGLFTNDQHKIVFGQLLDQFEIWKFGKESK